MIKITIYDFYNFLRRPNDHQIQLNLKNKILFVLILFALEIIIVHVLVFPLLFLINYFVPVKLDRIGYSQTFAFMMVYVVFVVPFLEELIFRFFLTYRRVNLVVTREQWTRLFPYLVYIPALIFGLVHIGNYKNDSLLFYMLSPIIILSQIIGGFVISFIRVRLNFYYSTFYHFMWNFLFAIAVPFVFFSVTKPYIEETSAYKITIQELPFFNEDVEQTFRIDSAQNGIKSMKLKQYSMQHLLDSLYSKDQYYVDDVLINLEFNSKTGMRKDEFLKVLKKEYKIIKE